jgi:hypothetical protein
MSRINIHMLILLVWVSPLPICGLVLSLDANPQPFHHIDFEQYWSSKFRDYVEPSEEDLHSDEDKIEYQDGDSQGPCKGDICNLHGKNAPALYVNFRPDGMGAKLQSVQAAMALAFKNGMNFGGVSCGSMGGIHEVPRQTFVSIMQGLYGTDICAKVPPGATIFRTVHEFERVLKASGNKWRKPVLLRDDCPARGIDIELKSNTTATMNDYFSPQFLKGIRKAKKLSNHSNGPTNPVVALHLRRAADIGPDRPDRYTGDAFYYNMAAAIKKHLPNAEFHVFSEGNPTQFAGYTERGMHLHLGNSKKDGSSSSSSMVREAWEYLSSADVVVTAKSSFSYVPSVFNPNCVIYQIMQHHPLGDWMIVDPDDTNIYDDELKACIQRIS